MNLTDLIKKYYLTILLVALIALMGTTLLFTLHTREQRTGPYMRTNGGSVREDPYEHIVKNQILKISPVIKQHYLNYMTKKPSIREGNIVVDWSIDTDGNPERVELVMSDFGDSDLESAIVKAIYGIKFPEPPENKYVSHTFRFKDVKGGNQR